MRKTLILLLMLAVASTSQASELIGNKTLLKKLEEKGLFTKEDVKEVESSYPRVKLGGRLQVQFKQEDGDTGADKTSGFFIRRARLTINAKLSDFGYMQLQPEAGKGSFTLKDAYIAFTPGPFKIMAGNHYVPFSLEALSSSKTLQFVERNLTSQLAPFRQMGLSVSGQGMEKKVAYQFGVWNGALNSGKVDVAGLKTTKNQIYHINLAENDNTRYMLAGRVEFHPLGYLKKSQENFARKTKLALGVSFYNSDDTPAGGEAADTTKGSNAYELDADLRWEGLSALFEYTARNIDYWDSATAGKTANQKSYTLQASYLLTKKLAIAARYEFLDHDDDDAGFMGADGQLEDAWTTIGLSYYLNGHHMKVQANYVIKDEKMPAGTAKPKNDTLLVQTAYSF